MQICYQREGAKNRPRGRGRFAVESIVANIMSLVVGFGIALLFISFINLYLLIDLMAALKKLRDKHRDKNDNDQSNDKSDNMQK